ncbi:glycine--tRNA ligase [Spiroplasma endosymbiont of Labia minor]|uniref:glycine--tRNA ligase n=1 Tax=Spiroplasma endosymbiont of Labia minor TaxID=3066305 RepID=UPI0030D1DA3A
MSIENMDELINHLKSQGFVFQGSEIYGGLANSWDYGPLGVEIKSKLKSLWWKYFVKKNEFNVGLDSSIILNDNVWKSSGHIGNFNDPLIDCKNCKARYRADKLIEENLPNIVISGCTLEQLKAIILENKINCPKCGKLDYTDIRKFELMFKTYQGVIADDSSVVHLRPETAQGIFINFKNVQRTTRKKIPFGIGQMGKSFRNEITPGNFIFRTREFEQMELEFFFNPNDSKDWFEYWLNKVIIFLNEEINLDSKKYHIRHHEREELSHYSKKTVDIEFDFPFGRGELWGISHRGDFDLKAHQNGSKQNLMYLDTDTNEKYLPNVIEPSVGVERLLLAIFSQSYVEELLDDGTKRIVFKLPKKLAPYQIAIIPLQKQQNDKAYELFNELLTDFDAVYDITGNIGKRYRRQDAIGTLYCITIDFDSEADKKVTVRERDTMQQERILISELKNYLEQKLK